MNASSTARRAAALAAALAVLWLADPGRADAIAYPRVSRLRPFTAETCYMSLPGFLRYRIFVLNGAWISRRTAVHIVNQQIATGED